MNKARSDSGGTALVYAALTGHEKVVKDLIKAGAFVDEPCYATTRQMDGWFSALQAAATDGHDGVVEELITAGADLNKGSGDETPLCAAARSDHMGIVERLMKAGADVSMAIAGADALGYSVTAARLRRLLRVSHPPETLKGGMTHASAAEKAEAAGA